MGFETLAFTILDKLMCGIEINPADLPGRMGSHGVGKGLPFFWKCGRKFEEGKIFRCDAIPPRVSGYIFGIFMLFFLEELWELKKSWPIDVKSIETNQ